MHVISWKGRGRKWQWPNLKYEPGICLGENVKNYEINQDSFAGT
jgi:hypothetical protein